MEANIFPEASIRDWVKDLLYLHSKGFLFGSFDSNDNLKLVACLYRVPEILKEYPKQYPEKSEGNILYVAWVASIDNDNVALKRMVTSYLNANKDVDTICFHDLKKGEELRVLHRNKTKQSNIEQGK